MHIELCTVVHRWKHYVGHLLAHLIHILSPLMLISCTLLLFRACGFDWNESGGCRG